MSDSASGPLSGLTVIDCSTILAGPFCATLLGDFGAEVIKIERPDGGDDLRHHGEYEEPLQWKGVGRNKQSVAVDLHYEEGQQVVRELVADADVFIENFRPGRLERWNLGWEDLSVVNPGLVMVRVTGFGQTGPYKDRPGFGTLAESMSGFAHMTGQPDGPPTLPAFGLADAFSAMYAAAASLMALYWRDVADGTGQYIDVSVLEPIFSAIMHYQVVEYATKGIVRERVGNRVPFVAPRNTYRTADDQWVAISTSAESIAKRVLRTVGGEELVEDPRFGTIADRVEHVDELDDVIGAWFAERTRDEAMAAFEDAGGAIAPIYDIADIFEDEHFAARDMFVTVDDDELGEVTLPGVVPKLSTTPGSVRTAGPALGAHTAAVLRERTSVTDDDIDDLAAAGVIGLGGES